MEFIYFYFFVIETKGKDGALPLEEIAALFDDPKGRDRILGVPTLMNEERAEGDNDDEKIDGNSIEHKELRMEGAK